MFISCRFGVTATEAEMNVIWESLLKNKNGTTNFHEFLRQFASRPATTACKTTLPATTHMLLAAIKASMLHARMKHGIQCIIVSQTLQMMCTTVYLLLAKPGKRLTEDHYFMRSKTLHRDEDMLQDALKAKVATFFPAIVCIVLGRSLGSRLTQSESIDTVYTG